MKQTVFDFLDDYSDDTIELGDAVPLSGEHIREMTVRRVPRRSGRPRPVARLLIAAAAAAILSITALAFSGAFGAGGWFRDFFGPLSTAQSGEVDVMSRELAGASQSGDAVLTPLAVLVDENVCYLRLRIAAPEGKVLGALPEGWSYKLYGGDGFDELVGFEPVDRSPYLRSAPAEDGGTVFAQRYGYCVAEFDLPDDDPYDNVIETMLRITNDQAMAEKGVRFNDGVSKRLTVSGLWIMSPELSFQEVFRADFSLVIDSSFDSRAVPLSCAGASWTDERGVAYALDQLHLSPLTLSFHYVSDLPMPRPPRSPEAFEQGFDGPTELPRPNAFSIVLKDGTVIDCRDFTLGSECVGFSINELDWQPYWSLWDYVIFDEPLDLSQVARVEYGGHAIPLPVDRPR